MAIISRDFRKISKESQSELRLVAINAISRGISQRESAKIVGVSHQTACEWVKKNRQKGKESLIGDNRGRSKGDKRIIIEEQGWKICPLICYDLRFPVFSRNNVDYDVLIYLANWPVKRIDSWNSLLKARSIENQCYTIGVNRVGEDGNNILFTGCSKIIDPLGNEIGSTNTGKEEILTMKITKEILDYQRSKMNFLKDRDDFSLN